LKGSGVGGFDASKIIRGDWRVETRWQLRGVKIGRCSISFDARLDRRCRIALQVPDLEAGVRVELTHTIHHLLELGNVGGVLEEEWDEVGRQEIMHVGKAQNDLVGGIVQPSEESDELHVELVAVPTKFYCMLQSTRQS
jgi:hypothetical protein